MDPSSVIVTNQSKPISIAQVSVVGSATTSHSVLSHITRPLLHAATLGDCIIGSRNVAAQLKRLDIFKSVDVSIEQAESSAVNIIFTVEEAPRLFARTGVDFGSQDGNMVCLRNLD